MTTTVYYLPAMTREQMLQYVKTEFRRCDPEKIILFGSWARGDADQYSDVDLIFILNTKKRFLDRLADLYQIWSAPFAVDILAYTPEEFKAMIDEENPLLTRAIAEGITLYEKSAH